MLCEPERAIRERVHEYLRAHRVMTVATLGEHGPAAAAVFYAEEGLDFYFLSAPHALHSRNIHNDPRVAVTIHEDCADWTAIRGVQMAAEADELEGARKRRAREVYAAKFPDIFAAQPSGSAIARALQKIRWYGLRVERLRFIDNERGFGHRDEWTREEFLAPVRPL